MIGPILGVIADDLTGSTDISSMLTLGGMRVVQSIGPPSESFEMPDADALVIALKTRSVPAVDAVSQSLKALEALRCAGVSQVQFKYCSTFDSTSDGNIGQVTDALAKAMECDLVAHIPSLPVNGRTVYKGHLFVGGVLLNESGMENHPLNPMTDANLVRWLECQTHRAVGLIDHATLAYGVKQTRNAMAKLMDAETSHFIGDAIDDADLFAWAEVLEGTALFAGGSGLATPLARRLATAGRYVPQERTIDYGTYGQGQTLILAGSCSRATLDQIEAFRNAGGQSRQIDPVALHDGEVIVGEVAEWAARTLRKGPVLIHASAMPEEVQRAQERLGIEASGAIVESALSQLAMALRPLSQTGRIVVAGGETSGAVISALDVASLRVGAEIDPGVPWTIALDASGRELIPMALKSGNFGSQNFFVRTAGIDGA